MRDYLLFYVNGKRCETRGETAFSSLSDFLRYELQLTGTKVVCSEGDCGACTILAGRLDGDELRYETVDSCIQFLYQLDCKHVVTVEGLHVNGRLHPVQQSMVDRHGSQCGYCTPGFVMALAGMYEVQTDLDADAMRLALTGNLCRCTGYLPILEAARAVEPARMSRLSRQFSNRAMIENLREHTSNPVRIDAPSSYPGYVPAYRTFFAPRAMEQALDFKTENPDAIIVSGGTELGVLRNKKGLDPAKLLSLTQIPGLDQVDLTDNTLVIGANVTWTQLESVAKSLLPEFYKIIIRFGSPQIRNVSTLVANVAHGSPIADSLPLLFITEAEVELASRGKSRRVKIHEFYKGYKIKDLAPDEIITRVLIPLPGCDELLKLYKVSKRNDLDIATFGAGIRLRRAGEIVTRAYIAYSGVAPTVVRLRGTEAFLQGKPIAEETFREAGRRARAEIKPISDVRGSRDFRWQLAENIMMKFYHDCVAEELESAAAE